MRLDRRPKLRLAGIAQLGDRQRRQLAHTPALAGLDEHLEDRAAEPVEQLPAEPGEARIVDLPQTDQEPERSGRRVGQPADGAIERVLQLGQGIDVGGAAGELEHGRDGGHHLVPARLGQQRAIVAQGLVAVGAREVEDLGHRAPRRARLHDVVLGRHGGIARDGRRQVGQAVDHDHPAAHGPSPSLGDAWDGRRPAPTNLGRGEVAIALLRAPMQAASTHRKRGRSTVAREESSRAGRRFPTTVGPGRGRPPHEPARGRAHRAGGVAVRGQRRGGQAPDHRLSARPDPVLPWRLRLPVPGGLDHAASARPDPDALARPRLLAALGVRVHAHPGAISTPCSSCPWPRPPPCCSSSPWR